MVFWTLIFLNINVNILNLNQNYYEYHIKYLLFISRKHNTIHFNDHKSIKSNNYSYTDDIVVENNIYKLI